MSEWFARWFNEDYLALYPHRDEADAARAVALVERLAPGPVGRRVLDVGCGPGRHARLLHDAGYRVAGLDLSAPLLRTARAATAAPLVRGDMRRLPVRSGSMDLVVNLFTSFGYFPDDAEHAAVIAEMARTLRPGGMLVLDFLNAARVRAELAAPAEETEGPRGSRSRKGLSADDRFVVKHIQLADGTQHEERVRLLGMTALAAMFAAAGLEVTAEAGDYEGAAHHAASPRAILAGRRR
jgi:SAM-dependent methyltransferase